MIDPCFLVLGLGRSGLSTAHWLKSQKIPFFVWDDMISQRELAQAQEFLLLNPLEENFPWEKITGLIISPGIPHLYPAPHPIVAHAQEFARKHEKQIEILSDLELFIRSFPQQRYIAVTGTNGKSTTTALLGHLLESLNIPTTVGANFGIPVFEMPLLGKEGIYVLEVSSYQLETTPSLNPLVAVLLNITPDHLDRHGGFDGYAAAKEKIFSRHGSSSGIDVLGIDTEATVNIYERLKKKGSENIWTFSMKDSEKTQEEKHIFKRGEALWEGGKDGDAFLCSLLDFPRLKGVHNAQNIAAVLAVLKSLDIPVPLIVEGIKTFPGLSHRQEYVRMHHGITFINDSKGTNVEATGTALAVFEDIYWILGGKAKDDDLLELKTYFPKVRCVFLIGESQDAFAKILHGHLPYEKCGKLENATSQAFKKAKQDLEVSASLHPCVLLSPACASFDQFKNFEVRGEKFKDYVKALP